MPEYISASRINLYMQCSLKYKFRYIDKLPVSFKSSGLAFGSAVHSALDWLHRERMNGNGASLERLYKIIEADWYAQKLELDIRFKDGEDEERLVLLAKEILGLYFHEPANEIKGAEIPFTVPIINPSTGEKLEVNLEGFMDLIEKDGTIVEFKTSQQTMSLEDVINSIQLTAYSYAYEVLYQKPPKVLRVVNFVKNKKPKINVLETGRGKSDYKRFFCLPKQVLKGIQAQVFFPRSGFWCKDCEYEEGCMVWGGL